MTLPMNALFPLLFRALSRAPLWLLHGIGAAMGWLAFAASGMYRKRLLANARQAGCTTAQTLASIGQAGRLVAELPRIWLGADSPVTWQGAELLEAALASDVSVLLMTPHVGSFETVARAYARRFGGDSPMTVLYRPARQTWLRPIVENARKRPGLNAVPTDLSGVKALIKTLRAKGCVGLLPDQVPPDTMGAWAPFFGQPAYTMTLANRLITQTKPQVFMLWAKRLPWGRGFLLQCLPLATPFVSEDPLAHMNREVERVVMLCPEQYLWGYARYKQPKPAS